MKLRLLFEQAIDAVDDPDAKFGKRCQTAWYRYHLQNEAGENLIRWEYDRERREPDYRYPLGHVHLHTELAISDRETRDLEGLHIATGRVAFESVFRHLIEEWQVNPNDAKWDELLDESIAGFYDRRTRH